MATTQKQFTLEGLCCGNCAAKIEKEVLSLDGVKKASIDLATKALTVKFSGDFDHLMGEVSRISVSIDEDIVVKAN